MTSGVTELSILEDMTVLIIGLGMIGGSIARGLKERGLVGSVTAVDRDRRQLELAIEQGVVDQGSEDPTELVGRADLVIIAVPTLSVEAVLRQLKPALQPATVVTDVASVKQPVMAAARDLLGTAARRFVPGHPIAGSERSGFQAADGKLFHHRKVILTPAHDTDVDAVRLVHALWRELGAQVLGMEVARHDLVLAATSHLPHLLSYALVDVLVKNRQSEDIFRYAAGGFADFSRLASSDPTMWADIFTANAEATIVVLDEYVAQLQILRNALTGRDYQFLKTTFAAAKSTRDRFMKKLHNPMQPDRLKADRHKTYRAAPGGSVSGVIRVPGDKSLSHRAVIFGSLADGVTRVSGFLEGEDALNTLEAFREMGVTVVGPEEGRLTIYGVGIDGLQAPRKPLYMGNSGTAMRLLAGLLAAQPFNSQLTGDESLSGRPMGRIAEPLRQMGACIETSAGGTPPLTIEGSSLRGIDYRMPMASAQVKSCLLLAALYADGETVIRQSAVSRDHTERMLQGFGYPLQEDAGKGVIRLRGGGRLRATDIDVPGDISSAAFFLVAATISHGATLRLEHVGVNPTRTGIIELLKLMGADIRLENQRQAGGEPVADLEVVHAPLRGIDIPEALIPLAIDEFPALFIAAACAAGTTRLRGAEELRVKESDRLQAMADGLAVLGIDHQLYADGIDITGGRLAGGTVDSAGDHRIAMAFAVASLRCEKPIVINDCANVATSFPGFVELANQAGLRITVS
jgi:3-phosphoshikimate 1-carboxyvinyltransferase